MLCPYCHNMVCPPQMWGHVCLSKSLIHYRSGKERGSSSDHLSCCFLMFFGVSLSHLDPHQFTSNQYVCMISHRLNRLHDLACITLHHDLSSACLTSFHPIKNAFPSLPRIQIFDLRREPGLQALPGWAVWILPH